MEKTIKFAVVLLFPLPLLYFPVSSIITHSALSIAHEELTAVISKDGGDHGTCKYDYDIEGKIYTGTGLKCGQYPKGYYMRIFVNPKIPQISSNEAPGTNMLKNIFVTLSIISAVLFSFFIILGQKEQKI
jgi:hypothetical protein